MQVNRIAALSAFVVLASANSISAAVVTGLGSSFAGGTVSGSVTGPNISVNETINTFSLNDGFWTTFLVTSPPFGATTYTVTKTITNNTSQTWTDYLVGVGCDGASTPPRSTVDCYSSGLASGWRRPDRVRAQLAW